MKDEPETLTAATRINEGHHRSASPPPAPESRTTGQPHQALRLPEFKVGGPVSGRGVDGPRGRRQGQQGIASDSAHLGASSTSSSEKAAGSSCPTPLSRSPSLGRQVRSLLNGIPALVVVMTSSATASSLAEQTEEAAASAATAASSPGALLKVPPEANAIFSPSAGFKSSFAREIVQNVRRQAAVAAVFNGQSRRFGHQPTDSGEFDDDGPDEPFKVSQLPVGHGGRNRIRKGSFRKTLKRLSEEALGDAGDEAVQGCESGTFDYHGSNNDDGDGDLWMSSTQFSQLLDRQEAAEMSKPPPPQPPPVSYSSFRTSGRNSSPQQRRSTHGKPFRPFHSPPAANSTSVFQPRAKGAAGLESDVDLLLMPDLEDDVASGFGGSFFDADTKMPLTKLKESCSDLGFSFSEQDWAQLQLALFSKGASPSEQVSRSRSKASQRMKGATTENLLYSTSGSSALNCDSKRGSLLRLNSREQQFEEDGDEAGDLEGEKVRSEDFFSALHLLMQKKYGQNLTEDHLKQCSMKSDSGGEMESCRSSDSELEQQHQHHQMHRTSTGANSIPPQANGLDGRRLADHLALNQTELLRLKLECQRLFQDNCGYREKLQRMRYLMADPDRQTLGLEKEVDRLRCQLKAMEKSRQSYEEATRRLVTFLEQVTTVLQGTSPAHRKLLESTRAEMNRVAQRTRFQYQSNQQQQQRNRWSSTLTKGHSRYSLDSHSHLFRAESLPGLNHDEARNGSLLSLSTIGDDGIGDTLPSSLDKLSLATSGSDNGGKKSKFSKKRFVSSAGSATCSGRASATSCRSRFLKEPTGIGAAMMIRRSHSHSAHHSNHNLIGESMLNCPVKAINCEDHLGTDLDMKVLSNNRGPKRDPCDDYVNTDVINEFMRRNSLKKSKQQQQKVCNDDDGTTDVIYPSDDDSRRTVYLPDQDVIVISKPPNLSTDAGGSGVDPPPSLRSEQKPPPQQTSYRKIISIKGDLEASEVKVISGSNNKENHHSDGADLTSVRKRFSGFFSSSGSKDMEFENNVKKSSAKRKMSFSPVTAKNSSNASKMKTGSVDEKDPAIDKRVDGNVCLTALPKKIDSDEVYLNGKMASTAVPKSSSSMQILLSSDSNYTHQSKPTKKGGSGNQGSGGSRYELCGNSESSKQQGLDRPIRDQIKFKSLGDLHFEKGLPSLAPARNEGESASNMETLVSSEASAAADKLVIGANKLVRSVKYLLAREKTWNINGNGPANVQQNSNRSKFGRRSSGGFGGNSNFGNGDSGGMLNLQSANVVATSSGSVFQATPLKVQPRDPDRSNLQLLGASSFPGLPSYLVSAAGRSSPWNC